MAAITDIDIYSEHGQLRRPLAWSVGLHLGFAVFVVLYAVFVNGIRGTGWGSGGGGEAMGATLVSSVPLPANPIQTQNVLATESKGLSKSQPKIEEKEPEAIPIPDKNAKKVKPAPVKSATQRKPQPEPEESNQIPYGEGGPVSKLYSMSAGGATGAFEFPGSGGDFGTRYAWYVRVIQQKVQDNWMKYEVDPRITEARRVYLVFDVMRDGHPANVKVEQSSGVPSLDQSAVRALQRIDTFGPLPSDYSGNKISVEWWFDYSKK
jgi:periplasmic protein TonB